jgi:hypothetical protein
VLVSFPPFPFAPQNSGRPPARSGPARRTGPGGRAAGPAGLDAAGNRARGSADFRPARQSLSASVGRVGHPAARGVSGRAAGKSRSRTPIPNAATEEACPASRPPVPGSVWSWPGRGGRPAGWSFGGWAAAGSSCVGVGRSVVRGGGRGRGGRCGAWRVVGPGVGCRSGLGSGLGRGRSWLAGAVVRWSVGRRVGSRLPGVGRWRGVVCVRGRCRSCRRGSCRAGRWRPVRVLVSVTGSAGGCRPPRTPRRKGRSGEKITDARVFRNDNKLRHSE